MFAELAGSAGRALLNTIDFFRDEPLMKWIAGLEVRDLTSLRDMIKNMKGLRTSLKRNEEDAMRNFDGRAESRSLRLRRIVESIEKEKNINEFFRTLIKFDTRGLQHIEDVASELIRQRGYTGLKKGVEYANLYERFEKERKQKQMEDEAMERIKKRKEEEKKKKMEERMKREEAMRERMKRREERREEKGYDRA